MFVPLHDGVPLRFLRAPYVTHGLIAVCVGLYLFTALVPQQGGEFAVVAGFGLIPSVLFGTAQVVLWAVVAWILYRRGWAWRI